MKKLLIPLLGVVFVLFGSSAYAAPVNGTWTNIPFNRISPRPKCSPKNDNCRPANSYVTLNQVAYDIDHTPKGATVTVSMFSQNRVWLLNKFAAADRRGVNIRYVTGKHDGDSPEFRRFAKQIARKGGGNSWTKVCTGACRNKGNGGVHHTKAITFSSTGGRAWVTDILSGNFTRSSAINQYNTHQRIVSNRTIYNCVTSNINSMRRDRWQGIQKACKSGPYTLYFFPQPTKPQDPILYDVNHTTCRYGKHTSSITVFMAFWSGYRNPFTRAIANKRKQHCNVQVIYSGKIVSSAVKKVLKRSHVPTWDVWHGTGDVYTHTKTVLISGKVSGKAQSISYTGSQNMTRAGQRTNDDILLRTVSYGQYQSNLAVANFARTHGARKEKW